MGSGDSGPQASSGERCDASCVAESQWATAFCFVLMLIGLYLIAGPALEFSTWHIVKELNPAFQEGLAWYEGHLALPNRTIDTALYDGRAYSVHPPLFPLLTLAARALGGWQGVPEWEFYTPWYLSVVVLPLPFVGFWAFHQVLRHAAWSAVLTTYWLIGTPLLPVLIDCQVGSINALNHVLNGIGLMLIAGDLLGRKRMWPTAIGLVISVWSRPHVVFFGLAALWIAWLAKKDRRRNVVVIMVGLGLSAGTLMALSWLKFGSPFETGYRYIYDYRRDSWLGERVYRYGVFSTHFIPENIWCMNVSPPRLRTSSAGIQLDGASSGVGIWMTSPLLLAAFVFVGRWWRSRAARALMLASAVVICTFLMYHATGAVKVGYFVYALDFLPVWMVVIAPWVVRNRWKWVTLGCLAYSALYFRLVSNNVV